MARSEHETHNEQESANTPEPVTPAAADAGAVMIPMPLVQELCEKINQIDPNLVVTLSSAKNAPARLRREDQGATPFDFTVTFHDFTNEPHNFVSAFAKAGNGFANIHSVE
jgi:hypothetical protein